MGELYEGAQVFGHEGLLQRSPAENPSVLQRHHNRENNEVVELSLARHSPGIDVVAENGT